MKDGMKSDFKTIRKYHINYMGEWMNDYFAVVTLILVMVFCLRCQCSEVPLRVLCAHAQRCLHPKNFTGSLKMLFVETDAWDFFFFLCV